MKHISRYCTALLYVFIIATLAMSCSKEYEMSTNIPYGYSECKSDKTDVEDALIDKYSRIVAVAMENEDFRELIKEMALDKFDGDYDVLSQSLHERKINNGKETVFELLSSVYDEMYPNSNTNGYTFLNEIIDVIPNLQVSVPIKCSEWTVQSFIPQVLPLPLSVDQQVETLPTYDSKGQISSVSIINEPSVPYVVVGVSERVDENLVRIKNKQPTYTPCNTTSGNGYSSVPGSILINRPSHDELELSWDDLPDEDGYVLYCKHEGGDYQRIATLNSNYNFYVHSGLTSGDWYEYRLRAYKGSDTSAFTTQIGRHASPRNNGSEFRISGIKFQNKAEVRNYEPWAWGCPELVFTVVTGKENDSSYITYTSNQIEPDRIEDIYDSEFPMSASFYWNQVGFGDILIIHWKEVDNREPQTLEIAGQVECKYTTGSGSGNNSGTGSSPKGLTIGGSVSGKQTIKYSNGGNITQLPVNFWDPLSHVYQDGGFYFRTSSNN